MSLLSTWERYFYKELFKNTFLFLLVFFGLYILIDYASHLGGASYHHSKLKIGEFLLHYLAEFSLRAEILIPFALLIATIQTLCKLNAHSELVALLAGGYSLHRLMRPFLIGGLMGTALLYFNNEVLMPAAMAKAGNLSQKYARIKNKNLKGIRANHLLLDDGALLIYKNFDPESNQFFEAYWIAKGGDVWRMDALQPFESPPKGLSVDHFTSSDSILRWDRSYLSIPFPTLVFNEKKLAETLSIPKGKPLSELALKAPKLAEASENEKTARHLTALYQKIAMPWLALIAVIAVAPFCIRFSRTVPVFFIFSAGIFGLVAIYMMMNAAIILGERQVLSPFIAIFAPMGAFMLVFAWRYGRMRT
jgi:lipopolysaccharide export system permease protein